MPPRALLRPPRAGPRRPPHAHGGNMAVLGRTAILPPVSVLEASWDRPAEASGGPFVAGLAG